MAIESKRRCGFRKAGGLYMVSGKFSRPCDRLPYPLDECDHCGRAYEQTRGFTWVKPQSVLRGDHTKSQAGFAGIQFLAKDVPCPENSCHICRPKLAPEKAGMMWVGQGNYTPESFGVEAVELGISKRINNIPKGLEIGETLVYLAHPQACIPPDPDGTRKKKDKGPGIFMTFIVQRIERVCLRSHFVKHREALRVLIPQEEGESDENYAKYYRDYWADQPKEVQALQRDTEKGIELFPVPDDDPDHNPAGKGADDDEDA